jgi:hypothetical protein
MRGDPAYGGSLDVVSRNIGIIRENAWCTGPNGELVFLTLQGLYALSTQPGSKAVPLSRDVLPLEFKNIDPKTTNVQLEYDVSDNGVIICLTSDTSNTRYHWWFDWGSKTYWPMTIPGDFEPMAMCSLQATAIEDSGVLLGGRDGKIRSFSDLTENDCGTAIASHIVIGPIALERDGMIGRLMTLETVLPTGSGDVSWGVYEGTSFEGAVGASTAADSGTWTAGLNPTEYPACVGQAFCLRIDSSSSRKWAFEIATATTKPAGRRRLE